jgi:CRP-like cAMP-binding protein
MDPTPQMLSQLPFFHDFSMDSLRLVSACAMHVRLEPGAEIFREGDPADRFYVILDGTIGIDACRADGTRDRLQVLGPGEVAGWSWLLPPHVWQFSATTLEPVNAICFAGTRLRQACETEPALGYHLVRAMAVGLVQRLQAARRRVLELIDAKKLA